MNTREFLAEKNITMEVFMKMFNSVISGETDWETSTLLESTLKRLLDQGGLNNELI